MSTRITTRNDAQRAEVTNMKALLVIAVFAVVAVLILRYGARRRRSVGGVDSSVFSDRGHHHSHGHGGHSHADSGSHGGGDGGGGSDGGGLHQNSHPAARDT